MTDPQPAGLVSSNIFVYPAAKTVDPDDTYVKTDGVVGGLPTTYIYPEQSGL